MQGLDPIAETEGMFEMQDYAGDKIGEEILGGEADGYAQDADAGQHRSHGLIQVEGIEGQDKAETDDGQGGQFGQDSGNVPISGEPYYEPVS